MSWRPLTVAVAVLMALGGGVYFLVTARRSGGTSGGAGESSGPQLVLHSGAGLRRVVSPLTAAFKRQSGIRVKPNYAGGGQLVGQLATHCRGELFMAGAERYADLIIEKGVADPQTKEIVAYFVPVILVQKENPKDIRSIQDFTRDGVRLGFGDERCCAVGGKTLKILRKNDIPLSEVRPNIVYKGKTVNELGVALETGGVDAVVMWRKNAANFTDAGDIVTIPLEKNVISPVPVVRLRCCEHPGAASRFIEFASGPGGRKIWKRKGFTLSVQELEHNHQ